MSLIKLTEKDFEYLYTLLKSPICDFDCGKICSLQNDGIPVCCETETIIPVLFKNEYKYLATKSNLWHEFIPETEEDEKLLEGCGYDDVLAICKGSCNCDRNYRAFICRTFPFYPFIDENKKFLGLTYNYDFEDKCILVGKPYIINKTYIEEFIKAWQYIFDRDEEEFNAHYEYSRVIDEKRNCKVIHIINKEGVYERCNSR